MASLGLVLQFCSSPKFQSLLEKLLLLFGSATALRLDLDEYCSAVRFPDTAKVGKALRQTVNFAEIDQHSLLVFFGIHKIALPEITAVCPEDRAGR